MKRLIVLGCTGSIGRSALEVARWLADRVRVVGLACGRCHPELAALAREFAPKAVAIVDPGGERLPMPAGTRRYTGRGGLLDLLRETDADLVLNGIAGAAGLEPSMVSLEAGRDLALANKESIVLAGHLVLAEAKRRGRQVLPVDSEHAALWSLLSGLPGDSVSELVLTASGGALREVPLARLASATYAETLAHPTWRMGARITVDSATLANKGLEVIEAHRLFGVPVEKVKVLVHPASVVHAMVRTADGALRMEASTPDMRIPIQNALTWPERLPNPVPALDLAGRELAFHRVDAERYPMLELAYQAARGPVVLPIVFNAADEVAVASFASGAIPFTRIAGLVGEVMGRDWGGSASCVEEVLAVDAEARARAREAVTA